MGRVMSRVWSCHAVVAKGWDVLLFLEWRIGADLGCMSHVRLGNLPVDLTAAILAPLTRRACSLFTLFFASRYRLSMCLVPMGDISSHCDNL